MLRNWGKYLAALYLVSWFLHLLGPPGPPRVPCPSGHSSAGIIKRSLCFCHSIAHLAFIPKAAFTLPLKICNHPAAGKRVYHLAFCPENKMLQKGHQKKKKSLLGETKEKKRNLFLKANWVESELSSHAVLLRRPHVLQYLQNVTWGAHRLGYSLGMHCSLELGERGNLP